MKLLKLIKAAYKVAGLEDDVEDSVDFVTDLVSTIKDTDGFKAKLIAGLKAIGLKETEIETLAAKILDLVEIFVDVDMTDDQLKAIIETIFEIGETFVNVLSGDATLADALKDVADDLGVSTEDTTDESTDED